MDVFTKRFLVAIALTFISALLILPLPRQKENLFFWGYLENGTTISERIKFKNHFLDIFINSTKFPSLTSHYDIHFKNKYAKSEDQEMLLRIKLRQESAFWSYARNFFNESQYESGTDFDIHEGESVVVRAVPIEIPIVYSSIPFCMGKNPNGCSDDLWFMSDNRSARENPRDMLVYATPNFYSLLIQWLLVFAFWVVIINSLFEITRKK